MAYGRVSQVRVEVVSENVYVPPRATWRAGTITVPGSTGSGSVTGLGGTPKAVIFYGTNWTTEDTAVTTSGLGVFRGMAGPKYDDGSLIQNAAFVSPPGDQHAIDNYAILALTTAGTATVLYRAEVDSFDADGFSYTFDAAASGGYKVVYLALMDDGTGLHVGSHIGTTNVSSFAMGFKAGASLHHGAWGGPVTSGNDRTQEWYGGGAYPGTSYGGWEAAFLAAHCFPSSSSGQTYNEINADQTPATLSATGVHFVGPFLTISNLYIYPAGTYLDEFSWNGDPDDGGMLVAWDDPDSTTGFATPAAAAAGTATVSGLSFEPGLLLGYSISDEKIGADTGGKGAAGFFVVTPDFQWCALVDGTSSAGAFQSFQRGFCDVVNGTDLHAGTVALTPDGFVMTTAEDDVAQKAVAWQAFGHPVAAPWIPQQYRRILN